MNSITSKNRETIFKKLAAEYNLEFKNISYPLTTLVTPGTKYDSQVLTGRIRGHEVIVRDYFLSNALVRLPYLMLLTNAKALLGTVDVTEITVDGRTETLSLVKNILRFKTAIPVSYGIIKSKLDSI